MRYKVKNLRSADALQQYWTNLNVLTKIRQPPHNVFVEIELVEPKEHPMWREINDAFMAGRISVVD